MNLSNSSFRFEQHSRMIYFRWTAFKTWLQVFLKHILHMVAVHGRGRLHLIAVHTNWFSCSRVKNVCISPMLSQNCDKSSASGAKVTRKYVTELACAPICILSESKKKKNTKLLRFSCQLFYLFFTISIDFNWLPIFRTVPVDSSIISSISMLFSRVRQSRTRYWHLAVHRNSSYMFFILQLIDISMAGNRDMNGWHLELRTNQKHIFHIFACNTTKNQTIQPSADRSKILFRLDCITE